MDLLKSQWERLRKQVEGLSASQKMLAAALVAIMVMTLAWWGRYAGQSEMEPVLNQAFSADEIGRVQLRLGGLGIRTEIQGDRVLVPGEEKLKALAALGYDQLLPQDTTTGFDEMVKDINPWEPTGTTNKKWVLAKQATLAKVIRGFPDVARAVVIIDATSERRFGDSVQPSASIDITTRSKGKASRKLANAAADVVSGSQAGLGKDRIRVVIDGATVQVADGGDGQTVDGDRMLEQIAAMERYRADHIRESLGDIKGLLVSVTMRMNTQSRHETRHEYDPTKVIQKERQTTNETTESTSSSPGGGEPGINANTGVSVGGGAAGGGGTTQTQEKTTATFENFPSESNTVINAPAGEAVVTGAAVRVPLSYFAHIYVSKNPNVKDPMDEALLQPLVDRELSKIHEIVMKCAGLESENQVVVSSYVDARPEPPPGIEPTASVQGLVGSHAREIGVGVLAVVSLCMASLVVRKGGGAPPVPSQAEAKETPALTTAGDVVGEAGQGNSLLDAVEMDDTAVKAQQMLEEVSTMVKEDPDGAATLVKRWLNRA